MSNMQLVWPLPAVGDRLVLRTTTGKATAIVTTIRPTTYLDHLGWSVVAVDIIKGEGIPHGVYLLYAKALESCTIA